MNFYKKKIIILVITFYITSIFLYIYTYAYTHATHNLSICAYTNNFNLSKVCTIFKILFY